MTHQNEALAFSLPLGQNWPLLQGHLKKVKGPFMILIYVEAELRLRLHFRVAAYRPQVGIHCTCPIVHANFGFAEIRTQSRSDISKIDFDKALKVFHFIMETCPSVVMMETYPPQCWKVVHQKNT